jgi:hypothetical protein
MPSTLIAAAKASLRPSEVAWSNPPATTPDSACFMLQPRTARDHTEHASGSPTLTHRPPRRLLHDLDTSPGTPTRIIEVVRSDAPRIVIDNGLKRIWYEFLAIVDTKVTYTVNYRNKNSLMWDRATKAPASFQVELKELDPRSTVRITLAKLPKGSWKYYVWDCINKKAVYWGSKSTALPLQMTASGRPSGVYPNQKYGEARVKVCSSLPCTC